MSLERANVNELLLDLPDGGVSVVHPEDGARGEVGQLWCLCTLALGASPPCVSRGPWRIEVFTCAAPRSWCELPHGVRWGMNILEVIRRKGGDVLSISPEATVGELLSVLHERNIGALVCLTGEELAGIVSERDVVHGLATHGPELLERPVSSIMTAEVETCEATDELEKLAERMTELRIRHLPVVDDGKVTAIVSIGDVVKQRLEDLQAEREALIDYVRS